MLLSDIMQLFPAECFTFYEATLVKRHCRGHSAAVTLCTARPAYQTDAYLVLPPFTPLVAHGGEMRLPDAYFRANDNTTTTPQTHKSYSKPEVHEFGFEIDVRGAHCNMP